MTSKTDFIPQALAAIQQQDFEALESLRSHIRPEHVPELVKTWRRNFPWPIKDGYAAVLMDQSGEAVRPLMEDALNSPTVETRAYALCCLLGRFEVFDSLLSDGGVDGRKVDAAIELYRATRPK